MNALLDLCPGGPDFRLDWDALDARFDWIRALKGCPQDPVWHAEGDVWIHTRLVLEALVAAPTWRARSEDERRRTFAACALHDVAKPETTRAEDDGRITARGHSKKGALRARRILWELGTPAAFREEVCHLVLHHQQPFFLVGRENAERVAARISWTTRADLLAEIARADLRGREAADREKHLEEVDLFEEFCRELGCLDGPYRFPSDAHRVAYFADETRASNAPVRPDATCTVTVLSGLPAAGKDHWVQRHGGGQPVVSLDALRQRLGIPPSGPQGAVVRAAREEAREHLRAGRDFLWNATNLSRSVRSRALDLAHAYGAHTRIVCVETTPKDAAHRNAKRAAPVPRAAIERMLGRWEAPDATEAHQLDVV